MDELTEDAKVKLRVEQDRLIKIITSFETLEKSEEWAILRELVFDKEIASIERQLLLASNESLLDQPKIYRLQGQRFQAKKYEVEPFIETLKKQLDNIKNKI